MQSAEDQDLFSDIVYARASTGKRLANYLIDVVVFYIVFFILVSIYFALFATDSELIEIESGSSELKWQLIGLITYAFFMGFVEAVFKGRTFGKLITRTTAVNLDGSQISAATAFKRGLIRAVPFCAFSALGSPSNPWQDKWTDTMVVDKKSIQYL